jgi:hypothetical protein
MVQIDDTSSARLSLLVWVARLGAVTAEALAEREQRTVASARGRLLAATRAGQLLRTRPLADGPSLYAATRAGLVLAGMRELDATRISAANARHTAVCAAVAVGLERAYPDHRLIGERELRARERSRGEELASATVRGAAGFGRQLHRPDLVLFSPAPHRCAPIAVEVELTVKAPRRLLGICRAWARCRCVSGALYVTPPEVRAPLERAIDRAGAARRIVVVPLDLFTSESVLDPGSTERTIPADS